ncbi:unannotated protein [freshwater metagenome]|uniref:Unannotated protein n=1 Tax=freshwater metagenome TaxID=449393 RepID=A0A6J6V428_9ZZZZ
MLGHCASRGVVNDHPATLLRSWRRSRVAIARNCRVRRSAQAPLAYARSDVQWIYRNRCRIDYGGSYGVYGVGASSSRHAHTARRHSPNSATARLLRPKQRDVSLGDGRLLDETRWVASSNVDDHRFLLGYSRRNGVRPLGQIPSAELSNTRLLLRCWSI